MCRHRLEQTTVINARCPDRETLVRRRKAGKGAARGINICDCIHTSLKRSRPHRTNGPIVLGSSRDRYEQADVRFSLVSWRVLFSCTTFLSWLLRWFRDCKSCHGWTCNWTQEDYVRCENNCNFENGYLEILTWEI